MTRTSFLIGMSAIAFAGAASAQTTRPADGIYTTNGNFTDDNGNRVQVSCTTGNSCTVNQGTVGQTFDSTGAVGVTGTGNSSTVTQRGNNQFGQNVTEGSRNRATTNQYGFNNSATVRQTGNNGSTGSSAIDANVATVAQGRESNNTGNNNLALVVQVRTAGAADTVVGNSVDVRQGTVAGGVRNTITQTQNGTGLVSIVSQTDEEVAAGFTTAPVTDVTSTTAPTQTAVAANGVAASNNSATVLQVGRNSSTPSTGTTSRLFQRESGNTANVSLYDGGAAANERNVSNLVQQNTLFINSSGSFAAAGAANSTTALTTANSPITQNSATVAITGQQNFSGLQQNGVQNTADVSLLNGGTGNTNNANAGTNPGTGVALSPAGTAGGQPAGRPQGNSSSISQSGRGNYAAVSSGGRVTANGGSGNLSSITQDQADARVTATTLNSTQTANTAHRALVYQRGVLDSAVIRQSNNNFGGSQAGVNTGTAAANVQSGSRAEVYQLSFNSTASIDQTGTNTGIISQGANREPTGASNLARVTQTDAGDIVGSTDQSGGGGFGGGTPAGSTPTSTRNYAEVSQSGITNTTTVGQNAIGATATVFQAVGTRSYTANIQQGTSPSATSTTNPITGFSTLQNTAQSGTDANTFNTRNVSASIVQDSGQGANSTTATTVTNQNGNAQTIGATIAQGGTNLTASATQRGATNTATAPGTFNPAAGNGNSILIGQVGTWNSASVTQNGVAQLATVEQRGSGTSANRNLITISQTGLTGANATTTNGNSALARQTANVGASAGGTGTTATDPAGTNTRSGVQSAEIRISQNGFLNSATIEQRGKGQFASITQNNSTATVGTTGNTGSILQDAAATNAVAILSQSGTGNTYTIYQDTAGQFANVSQTGNNNTLVSASGMATGGNIGGAGTAIPTTTAMGTPPATVGGGFGTVN